MQMQIRRCYWMMFAVVVVVVVVAAAAVQIQWPLLKLLLLGSPCRHSPFKKMYTISNPN
jgi:hypothetical protein